MTQFVAVIPRPFTGVILPRQVPGLPLCIPFFCSNMKHFAVACNTLFLLTSNHLSNLAQTF